MESNEVTHACSMTGTPTSAGSVTLQNIVINMVPVNDPPVVTVNPPDDGCFGKFDELAGTIVPILYNASYVTITDQESDVPPLDYVKLVVELLNPDMGDVMSSYTGTDSAPAWLNTTVMNSGTKLVFTFHAINESEVKNILQNVYFLNSNRNLNTDHRRFLVTVADKDGGYGSANLTLCICPFNDPPVLAFVSSFVAACWERVGAKRNSLW